jgi:hypothetical protein
VNCVFFYLLQVSAIVSCLLGPDRAEKITIFAGDVVPRKKPDPVSLIWQYGRHYSPFPVELFT